MRMSLHLPNPETLNDIAIVGLKNQELSTSAIGELLEQIYALDHPTLVCVDGFNWFYRPSHYQSYRYFNDRGNFGHLLRTLRKRPSLPRCYVSLIYGSGRSPPQARIEGGRFQQLPSLQAQVRHRKDYAAEG